MTKSPLGKPATAWLVIALVASSTLWADESSYQVGVAQIDITPEYPVRLSGFGFRRTESEGITQKIWAKAIAIGNEIEGPAILIALDNLGVPDEMVQIVAARLKTKTGLKGDRFAVTATHTHTAPMLTGVAPTLFGVSIPPEHQEHIDRYTRELTDKLEQLALAAVKELKPSRLSWAIGQVSFARNRRTKNGPVDHDLPMLVVQDLDGKERAIYVSYACHCVTLSNNKLSGDWAGFAQEKIQADHPGVIALTSVGCGADSNPDSGVTGDVVDRAAQQGAQIAAEVTRLLKGELKPLSARLTTLQGRIDLPLDEPPTRAQWEEKAKRTDAVGYHARVNLARLARGEKLQTKINYPIQTWLFGEQLAMVFLPGEVVVDFSLRLKREFDRSRIWVNAYANDAPCYIPSERVLKEGGYEGGDAMIYYDRPTKFAIGVEGRIIDQVHAQIPKAFRASRGTDGIPAKSPQDALHSIKSKPGFEVELVAAEPLIVDPVAIDWGADGRLWVVEMHDYPTGIDENWKPGGRVKFLEDTDGDGRYDKATLFLGDLPFPTGVMAWRKGVLICAAPDILYGEDTDGDGKADVVKRLFSGFYTDNYQARVNSLSLGLDNWIYGANGLLGGVIRGSISGKDINIRGQDFRMNPDTGAFEAVSGLTQQGRVRDDWDNWFGCDNSTLIRQYPLPDHYLRRNPNVTAPDPSAFIFKDTDPNQLFPTSRTLPRYNDPGSANRVTSACGLVLYRDELLGTDFSGDAFTCEPVHNLVHRLKLEPSGVTFSGQRSADEQQTEFLSSSDNWFRPVQARTGPDGALWIVDMYRYLIEHPRWVPKEQLATIDVRAGADKGRIYRVFPQGKKLRSIINLAKLGTPELVAALDTSNGTTRDLVHLELLHREDKSAVEPLTEIAQKSPRPECRVQAMCVLDGLHVLTAEMLRRALNDLDPRVRQHGIRLSERELPNSPSLAAAVLNLTNDADVRVRYQLALSLGEWNDPRAGIALGRLASTDLADRWLRAAVLSSAGQHGDAILQGVLSTPENSPGRAEMTGQLIATVAGFNDERVIAKMFATIVPAPDAALATWQISAMADLLETLDRKKIAVPAEAAVRVEGALIAARNLAKNESVLDLTREAAIRLLGHGNAMQNEDLELLGSFLKPTIPARLQTAALANLRRHRAPQIPGLLLANWSQHSPSLRSEILSVLLSRDEWVDSLLAAVTQGVVQPSEIPLASGQRLLQHSNAETRKQATALLSPPPTEGRDQVLKHFQSALLLTGNAAKGAEQFGKTCASCHALSGLGFPVGPDLAPLVGKGADYLLKNILDPNAAIEPRYLNYTVETKDGLSLNGVINSETSTSVNLVQGGGVQEKILRTDIAEIRASSVSLMPEGLEQNLTPQDMADLLAFIRSALPRKKFSGNQPGLVEPAADDSLALLGTNGEIYGGEIAFEAPFQNIGYWSGSQDHAVWEVRVDQAAAYDVYLDWACDDSVAGNPFSFDGGDPALRGKIVGTGGWDKYRQAKIGIIKLQPGRPRLTFRSDGDIKGALLDLRGIKLVKQR